MIFDGILETSTTTGTGDLTTSAVTGRLRFTDFFVANATESSADPFYYAITTQDSPPQFLEIGIGYCSAAGTLKRIQPIATWVSGSLAHFSTAASLPAGTKNVICTGDAASYAPGIPDVAAPGGTYGVRAIGPPHLAVSGSSASTTKDRLYYTPIYLATPQRVSSVKLMTGGTVGSGGTHNNHIGLYAALRTGGPGRRLQESGDLTTAAYGVLTYSFTAVRLPPGWYWGAFVHDFASTAQTIYTSSGAAPVGNTPAGWNCSSGLGPVACFYENLSAGWTTMPALATVVGSLSSMINSAPMPVLGLA